MTVTVSALRCESLDCPMGLGECWPRLSWQLQSQRRGVRQSAYEIMVAASLDDLYAARALWHTGKVPSDQSVHLHYAGAPLQSRGRYYWQVRVWDEQDQVTAWSEPAWWEMGLLEPNDWQAGWLEPQQQPVSREPALNFFAVMQMQPRTPEEMQDLAEKLRPCPMLRRAFEITGIVKRARLYATAHGLYAAELNGERIGNRELAPENTSYPHYLMHQTYDVTGQLKAGENVLGVTLADGWYAGRTSAGGDSVNYGDRLAALLQLEIDYEDGTTSVIGTDEHWHSTLSGPLIYSDLFIGESYDARRELPGWSQPGFGAQTWEPVVLADYGYENIVPQHGEEVRVLDSLPAVQLIQTPAGEQVLDFGQVIAGRLRMRVSGPAGTRVILQHSEMLDGQGNFFQNIRWRNKEQTDFYVLRGDGEEVYEPRFTFHGFRYVKVTGYPGELRPEDFSAQVIGSALEQTGDFQTDDPRLNQLQHNIVWSQRGNFLSIPTDCPQRERTGWTGDLQVFAPTALFNMHLNACLTRWLRNVQLEQLPDGQIPNFVPGTPSMADPFNAPSSAGWGDACIIVPWAMFQEYADPGVLAENYPTMQRWLNYVRIQAEMGLPEGLNADTLTPAERERQKYLWNTGFHFGDWLIPSLPNPIEGVQATKELVATCFYAYSARLLSEVAAQLGQAADAQAYRELHERVAQAFEEGYFHPDGRLSAHFQGAYVLALHLGLISGANRPAVIGTLADMIEANGNRLDTGFMSVPYLLDVLCDHGRPDVAYRLLFQTECPSWLYEVERGATTIWEAWDAVQPDGAVRAVSFNHYAFGCVGDWMYRRLAGIQKAAPGYRQLVIRPDFGGGLRAVRATHQSVYGRIESDWTLSEDGVRLRVVIPPNTSGTVFLPSATLFLDGQPLQTGNGVTNISPESGGVKVELGSGTYLFTTDYSPLTPTLPSSTS